MTRRGGAQCDFATIYTEHSGIPTWGAMSCCDAGSWQETELHQAMADLRGKFQTVKHAMLSVGEIQDGRVEGSVPVLSLLETQLHNTFSIGHQNAGVKAAGNAQSCYTWKRLNTSIHKWKYASITISAPSRSRLIN